MAARASATTASRLAPSWYWGKSPGKALKIPRQLEAPTHTPSPLREVPRPRASSSSAPLGPPPRHPPAAAAALEEEEEEEKAKPPAVDAPAPPPPLPPPRTL